MTKDNAQDAFKVLIEILEESQKMIIHQGKEAFEREDFPQAERVSEKGKQLQRLVDQVKELQTQWSKVMPTEVPSSKFEPIGVKPFRPKSLKSFYDEYSKDMDEAKDYRWRKEKYAQIPDVLDKLIEAENQKAFFEFYEDLVGKSGQKSLWHSGSLFRQKSNVAKEYSLFQEMVREIRDHPQYSASELFTLGKTYTQQINGLAVNVMTEVLHSYYIDRCPVLNSNSLTSMIYLVDDSFPSSSNSFKADQYQQFAEVYKDLTGQLGLEDFGHVDHFLNYVYWRYAKKD